MYTFYFWLAVNTIRLKLEKEIKYKMVTSKAINIIKKNKIRVHLVTTIV